MLVQPRLPLAPRVSAVCLSLCAALSSCKVGEGGPPAVDGGSGGAAAVDGGGPSGDAALGCGWVRIVDLGGDSLRVRAEPSADAQVVASLAEGTVIAVLETTSGDTMTDPNLGRSSDQWLHISSGWITELYTECTTEPDTSEQAWTWPVPSNTSIAQDYGNPISYQSCGFHTGLDVSSPSSTLIVAAGAGTIVHVGPMWFDGPGVGRGPHAIIIDHGNELYSTYGHNRKALVAEGDLVTTGQPLAEMGSLGYSSGPHLHLEFVEGEPFTGNWAVPFKKACQAYRDPKDYVLSN